MTLMWAYRRLLFLSFFFLISLSPSVNGGDSCDSDLFGRWIVYFDKECAKRISQSARIKEEKNLLIDEKIESFRVDTSIALVMIFAERGETFVADKVPTKVYFANSAKTKGNYGLLTVFAGGKAIASGIPMERSSYYLTRTSERSEIFSALKNGTSLEISVEFKPNGAKGFYIKTTIDSANFNKAYKTLLEKTSTP